MRFNLTLVSFALSLTLVTAAPLSYASHLSDPNAKKDTKDVVSRMTDLALRSPLSYASHLSDPNAKKDAKKVVERMIDIALRGDEYNAGLDARQTSNVDQQLIDGIKAEFEDKLHSIFGRETSDLD